MYCPSVTTSPMPSISVVSQHSSIRDCHLGFGDIRSSAPLITKTHDIVRNIRELVLVVQSCEPRPLPRSFVHFKQRKNLTGISETGTKEGYLIPRKPSFLGP